MEDYVCPIWIDLNGSLVTAQRRRIGRDDRIWTRDILYPKQTRYQAALHPFQLVYSIIVENPCPVFQIEKTSIDIKLILLGLSFFIYSLSSRRSYQRYLWAKRVISALWISEAFPIEIFACERDPNSVYPVKQALPPASTQTKNVSA